MPAEWIIGSISLILLTAAMWRHSPPPIRAVFTVASSASLWILLTESLFSLVLLALDVALVAATWGLARRGLLRARWGVAWIAVLVLVLVVARLSAPQPQASSAGVIGWLGVAYFIFRLIHV